jgi:hypothetical protein
VPEQSVIQTPQEVEVPAIEDDLINKQGREEEPQIESESITTQRANGNGENVDGAPTPIGTNEIIKLENEVAKTIENANSVVDVPMPPYQQEDRLLEDIIKSSRPEEITISTDFASSILTTIQTEAPTQHNNHHSHHHRHDNTNNKILDAIPEEPESSEIDKMHEEDMKLGTTAISSEEIIREPITTTVIATSITNAPESETIFTPINNAHNENINIGIVDDDDEITTTTTMATMAIENSSMVSSCGGHNKKYIATTQMAARIHKKITINCVF